MQSERTDVGTIEELHASATRLTGLDDFGEDDGIARDWVRCFPRTGRKRP